MNEPIEIRSLIRQYPGFQLGPVSMTIRPGTTLALVGPNGAGKSTLMDILAGVREPTSGTVSWPVPKQPVTGFASENLTLYERWTARQNFRFLSGFFPTWSADEAQRLTERLSLPINRKLKDLSKGNRLKVSLVAALTPKPDLLLLDEPTSGLDPLVRAELLDLLWESMEEYEPTILYSTHILSDIERIADEVAFIVNGEIVLHSEADALKESWGVVTFRHEKGRLRGHIIRGVAEYRSEGALHSVITDDARGFAERLGAEATGIRIERMRLEDIALHVLRAGSTPATPVNAAGEGNGTNAQTPLG